MNVDLSKGHLVRTCSAAHGKLLERCGYVKVPADMLTASLQILGDRQDTVVDVTGKSPFAVFVAEERSKKNSLISEKIIKNA